MALSDRTDILVKDYLHRQYPEIDAGLRQYMEDELQKIELSIQTLADAAIQVADNPPSNPRKGMVRYAVTGWDPLGNGFSGLVVYTGNAWAAV